MKKLEEKYKKELEKLRQKRRDYYDLLGIKEWNISPKQIELYYQKERKKWKPYYTDFIPINLINFCSEALHLIEEAYCVLSCPELRKIYDKYLIWWSVEGFHSEILFSEFIGSQFYFFSEGIQIAELRELRLEERLRKESNYFWSRIDKLKIDKKKEKLSSEGVFFVSIKDEDRKLLQKEVLVLANIWWGWQMIIMQEKGKVGVWPLKEDYLFSFYTECQNFLMNKEIEKAVNYVILYEFSTFFGNIFFLEQKKVKDLFYVHVEIVSLFKYWNWKRKKIFPNGVREIESINGVREFIMLRVFKEKVLNLVGIRTFYEKIRNIIKKKEELEKVREKMNSFLILIKCLSSLFNSQESVNEETIKKKALTSFSYKEIDDLYYGNWELCYNLCYKLEKVCSREENDLTPTDGNIVSNINRYNERVMDVNIKIPWLSIFFIIFIIYYLLPPKKQEQK